MTAPTRAPSLLEYVVVTVALAVSLAVTATAAAVVWIVVHPPPVPAPVNPAPPCLDEYTDPYAEHMHYMRASNSAFFAANSSGVNTPASRSAPNWVSMAARSGAGVACAVRTGASASAISAACRFARALSLKLVDQKPALRAIVCPIGSVADNCLPANRSDHGTWSTSDGTHGIAVGVIAITSLSVWPWWISAAAGVLLLLCGISTFALVGWATYRARQLDDPTHPYLSPIDKGERIQMSIDQYDLTNRHAATQQIMRYFTFSHLPEGEPRDRAQDCASLAHAMVRLIPDGPELTVGLRKLLEAKDCFVRASLDIVDS